MIAREMTNLTPIQLEEFESVFRHFDKDLSNTLQEIEFSAALASLSLVYDEQEMHEQFMSISSGKGYVTFEQFIRFMVSVTEDQNTAEQVFQSFREVADGKVRGINLHFCPPLCRHIYVCICPLAPRPHLLACCHQLTHIIALRHRTRPAAFSSP